MTGTVGRYERMGTAVARRVGEHVVVDVPMSFEAGDYGKNLPFSGEIVAAVQKFATR